MNYQEDWNMYQLACMARGEYASPARFANSSLGRTHYENGVCIPKDKAKEFIGRWCTKYTPLYKIFHKWRTQRMNAPDPLPHKVSDFLDSEVGCKLWMHGYKAPKELAKKVLIQRCSANRWTPRKDHFMAMAGHTHEKASTPANNLEA